MHGGNDASLKQRIIENVQITKAKRLPGHAFRQELIEAESWKAQIVLVFTIHFALPIKLEKMTLLSSKMSRSRREEQKLLKDIVFTRKSA